MYDNLMYSLRGCCINRDSLGVSTNFWCPLCTARFSCSENTRIFYSVSDALRQLECVGCVKAVMNNEIGLTFIIESQAQNFVQKLAQGKLSW